MLKLTERFKLETAVISCNFETVICHCLLVKVTFYGVHQNVIPFVTTVTYFVPRVTFDEVWARQMDGS